MEIEVDLEAKSNLVEANCHCYCTFQLTRVQFILYYGETTAFLNVSFSYTVIFM